MKPTQTEKRIQDFTVETNSVKDKRILEMLFAEQAQSQLNKSGFAMVFKAAILVTGAGIVVTAGVWLSITRQTQPYPADATIKVVQPQTASELTSVMSLDKAFYSGGFEAVEKQLDKAEKIMAPKRHEPVTTEQLLCELLKDC